MKIRIATPVCIFCSLLALVCCHLLWAEDPVQIPEEFSNKELLTNARWTDEAFVNAIISKWDKYTGTQGFKEKEVLCEKKMQIYGNVFSVEARRYKSDGVFEFVFVGEGTISKDFREKFISHALRTWGAPLKDIDYSWGLVDNHDVEWLLGNTHIWFSIFRAEMDDNWTPSLCLLSITQPGKYPPLKDLISLKCEGQSRLVGFNDSKEVTPGKPFLVIVDLNHNRLCRRDRSMLGSIVKASEDFFIAEWKDKEKDLDHRFEIDRKLGTYEWRMMRPDKKQGVVDWGKCEKTDLQIEPKF